MRLITASTVALLAAPALANDPAEVAALERLAGGVVISSDSFTSEPQHDHSQHSAGHGKHAPIGVMGDHVHEAGEWMISLRAMRMSMDGLSDNGDSVSKSELFGMGYMVAPLSMDMDMLMLGGMYAPTDNLTLMVMVPYLENSMKHETGMGARFETESSGIGDVRLTGLVGLAKGTNHSVHLNLGLSLPTGSIDEKDDTPMMADAKLPYPMQLGTGTYDFLPGLTYVGNSDTWAWGAQGIARLHLGENDEDYRHGNRFDATAWAARTVGDSTDVSLRLTHAHWSNFHGADPDLNPGMVPTADPKLRGGDRLDASLGLAWNAHESGHRLGFEFGVPVYQDLDGPALETDWVVVVGWQLLR